jgi:hypothetical protein
MPCELDVKHFNDIERLAFVGDGKWEKGMAVFCRPFTTAEIKYFDHAEIESARQWVQENGSRSWTLPSEISEVTTPAEQNHFGGSFKQGRNREE